MTTRELIETVTHEEGIAIFNSKKTDKEIYDLLVLKGLTDSFETFVLESQEVVAEKAAKMNKEEIMTQIEGAELTDEQLEMIAGGKEDDEVVDQTAVKVSLGIICTATGAAAGGLLAAFAL